MLTATASTSTGQHSTSSDGSGPSLVKAALRMILALVSMAVLAASSSLLYPLPPLSAETIPSSLDVMSDVVVQDTQRRAIDVELSAQRSVITYRLSVDEDSTLVDTVRSGGVDNDPAGAAYLTVGWVSLGADTSRDELTDAAEIAGPVAATWAPPQAQRTTSGWDIVFVAYQNEGSPNPAALRVLPAEACREGGDECTTALEVRAPGYRFNAAYPADLVTASDESTFRATVAEPLRLDIGTRQPTGDFFSPGLRTWMAELWRYGCVFAPWVVLLWVFRTRRSLEPEPGSLDLGTRVLGVLLWGAVVGAFVLSQQLLSAAGVARGSLAAVSAALFVWALWAERSRSLGFTWLVVVVQVAAVVGAVVVLAVVLADAKAPQRALAGVLAVLGATTLAWALSARGTTGIASPRWQRTSQVAAGLAGAGVLVVVAATQNSASILDRSVSGVASLVCTVLFLSMLTWATVRAVTAKPADAAPDQPGPSTVRAQLANVRHWLPRLLVVLVVAAIVTPRSLDASAGQLFSASVDAVTNAAIVMLQLGLIVTTGALLWRVARARQARWSDLTWLAGAVAATFLLRGDVVYLLPWSLLAGVLLIVTFVLEHSPSPSREAAGLRQPFDSPSAIDESAPGSDGSSTDAELVRRVVDEAARAETLRRHRDALRKRMSQAENVPSKGDEERALVRAWNYAKDQVTSPPTPARKHAAMGWAGTPSATERALRSTGVALAIGIPLSIPFLAGALSDLTDLRGLDTWVRVLTAFFLMVRFPLYGFFFGYFMPLLRGATGLGKAGRLFVLLAVTEAIALILPFESTWDFTQAFVLRALQLAALCIAIGVAADLHTMRTIGKGMPALLDLYGVKGITFSIGTAVLGIATAAATAVATAGLQSAAQEYLSRILDEPTAAEQVVEPADTKTTDVGG